MDHVLWAQWCIWLKCTLFKNPREPIYCTKAHFFRAISTLPYAQVIVLDWPSNGFLKLGLSRTLLKMIESHKMSQGRENFPRNSQAMVVVRLKPLSLFMNANYIFVWPIWPRASSACWYLGLVSAWYLTGTYGTVNDIWIPGSQDNLTWNRKIAPQFIISYPPSPGICFPRGAMGAK